LGGSGYCGGALGREAGRGHRTLSQYAPNPLKSRGPVKGRHNQTGVDANFKETQLRDLRIGQAVDLYVDMYGDRQVFNGRISGFTLGTGSTLALLPPQMPRATSSRSSSGCRSASSSKTTTRTSTRCLSALQSFHTSISI